jgi:hypothetical protein
MSPAHDALPITLDEVIDFVGRIHPDAGPLFQLQDAVVVGERLEALGDDLVGHFVSEARDDGATWSAIGETMGVSKQAAQKRFVVSLSDRDDGLLSRFTPRARHMLSVARDEAERMGAEEVATTHLVLGLMNDPEGLAMRALVEMGVTADGLRAAIETAAPAPSPDPPSRPPFAAESRTVLRVAVEEAIRLGHNYIGTEHLLLAILAAPHTDGARVLTAAGATRRKAMSRIKRQLERIVAERTRTS